MPSKARQLASAVSAGVGITPGTWTTATRPASPVAGQFGFNTTLGYLEWYSSSASSWIPMYNGPSYTIEYFIVGGGGGSAGGVNSVNFGGAGAGGVARTASATVNSAQNYTVTVGAGGTGALSGTPTSGSTSGITGIATATGGNGPVSQSTTVGGNNADFSGGTGTGSFGAGGGAGAGGNASGNNGGNGATWAATGNTYGGGGAGQSSPGGSGTAGSGGGASAGASAAANTGGGAGSGDAGAAYNGGSGRVIIRYQNATQRGTGGTVTQSGGYFYHTFTSSGSYTA